MNDQTDAQLLLAYAEHRSEPAFAELVRRHVDIVHSAVLRMVRDSHLAQDVTQGVFLALASNAAQLTDRPVLSGWLHRTAQNIAAQTVRTNVRRRVREQEAAAMNELLTAEPDALWEHIAPQLDTALGELSEADRDALLLRYFERKSASEMATTLGISDEAAQKRVNRAVERLREFFAKRGLTVGASGLVIVISANAVQAAPVGLVVTISTAAALAGTSIATTATATTIKTIAMTTLQKTFVTATVAVLTVAGIYEARQASTLRAEVRALRQEQTPRVEPLDQLRRERDDATRQLAALRDENERLNRNLAELPKLRGDFNLLRQQVASQKPQISQANRTPSYIAKDQLAFAGHATPEAALETMTWVHLNGTYDQLIECSSPEMLALEGKEGTQRRDWFETHKKTFAPLFKGVQIMAKKVLANDRVELKFKHEFDAAINQLPELQGQRLPDYFVQAIVKVGSAWKLDGLPRPNEESWDEEGQIEKSAP